MSKGEAWSSFTGWPPIRWGRGGSTTAGSRSIRRRPRWRRAGEDTDPLRAVVIYDGGVTVDQDTPTMELSLGGYYDASNAGPSKMTHLVADGGLRPETLSINDTPVPESNPFPGALGSAWDNPTYTLPPGSVADAGVTTGGTLSSTSIDCLSRAGVLFS